MSTYGKLWEKVGYETDGQMTMFRGISSAKLDSKGRMSMPARFRERLIAVAGGRLVVTVDMREKCLLLYPLPEWEAVQQKLDALPNIRPETRWLQRILIGHATDLELDANGRILLPAPLRDHCGLEKALVLVGQGNKIEIWAQDTWRTRVDAHTSDDNGALLAEGGEIIGLSV